MRARDSSLHRAQVLVQPGQDFLDMLVVGRDEEAESVSPTFSGAAQFPQNFESSLFSAWQRGRK